MTQAEVNQLCVLLSKTNKEQWSKVKLVVNEAFQSVMDDFYESHRNEWVEHGKTPEWFSNRLAVLSED